MKRLREINSKSSFIISNFETPLRMMNYMAFNGIKLSYDEVVEQIGSADVKEDFLYIRENMEKPSFY